LTIDLLRSLRHGLDDAVTGSAMADSALDDWDRAVLRHGAATRHRPAGLFLQELAGDFAELQRRLSYRQPISTARRLTIVTAQMAGLMSLTLLKLGENDEARAWARTARHAADETGDPAVRSWVRAQEAYAHYYDNSPQVAILVAREAQAVAAGQPCAGVALSAALEARAAAALGDHNATVAALHRAESALVDLDQAATMPSAFGYDEAQLRFHEGSAYSNLHDTGRAWHAQSRALDLYPSNDYLDRALIHLDRAACLIHDGDVTGALTHAARAVHDLSPAQRSGLIDLRAHGLLGTLTAQQRAQPAARDLREMLALPPSQGVPSGNSGASPTR
jgi:tetratricopeptide (TPR) repeat protein